MRKVTKVGYVGELVDETKSKTDYVWRHKMNFTFILEDEKDLEAWDALALRGAVIKAAGNCRKKGPEWCRAHPNIQVRPGAEWSVKESDEDRLMRMDNDKVKADLIRRAKEAGMSLEEFILTM